MPIYDADELAALIRHFVQIESAKRAPPPVNLTVYDISMRFTGGWILCQDATKIVRVLMPNLYNPQIGDVVIALPPNEDSPTSYYVGIGVFNRTSAGYMPPPGGSGVTNPTVSATITIDLSLQTNVYAWTATGNESVVISGTQYKGQQIILQITNDNGAGHVITFSTGFKSSGTLTGTTSKTAIIGFTSDGSSFYETSRVTAVS